MSPCCKIHVLHRGNRRSLHLPASFLLEVSSCPCLGPNSIYFMTLEDFCEYNLATRTSNEFEPPKDAHVQPHWTPPASFYLSWFDILLIICNIKT
ncbi:hypothetical protein Bca4012_012354 [Brassica carinata]